MVTESCFVLIDPAIGGGAAAPAGPFSLIAPSGTGKPVPYDKSACLQGPGLPVAQVDSQIYRIEETTAAGSRRAGHGPARRLRTKTSGTEGKMKSARADANEGTCRLATSSVTFGDSFPTVARLEFSIRAVPFRLRRNRLIASRAIGPCKGKRTCASEPGQLYLPRRSSMQPQTPHTTPDRAKRGQTTG